MAALGLQGDDPQLRLRLEQALAQYAVTRTSGAHQRRLRRMIDALERQLLDPAAPGYAVHDRYVARLLDAFDLMAAAYRLAR